MLWGREVTARARMGWLARLALDRHLRHKLGADRIETVRGIGYRLCTT